MQNRHLTGEYLYQLSERLSNVTEPQHIIGALLIYPKICEASCVVIFSQEFGGFDPTTLQVCAHWSPTSVDCSADLERLHHFLQTADSDVPGCDSPLFIENPQSRSDSLPLSTAPRHVTTWMVIPLQVGKRRVGGIGVGWKSVEIPDEEGKRFYAMLGHQIAWVLHGLLLQNENQRRLERTEKLLRLGTALLQASNEQEILVVLSEVLRPYAPDALLLSYIDLNLQENVTTLTMISRWTALPAATPPKGGKLRQPRTMPAFLRSYLTNLPPDEAILIEDVPALTNALDATQRERTGFNVSSAALIPLYRGSWQGLVHLNWNSQHVFSEEEKSLYAALIHLLSPIIASRRAYLAQEAAHRESEARAKELETVSKVSAAASRNLNFEQLLQTVVDLSTSRFNLYHAHVYLLDLSGTHLILAATSGETGKAMKAIGVTRLPLARDPSIAARCGRIKEGIIVNDVSVSADFIPNPLLPEVRSELAVPMLLGESLVGVLNLQSKEINHFTANILLVMHALADEIAVAVQNVRLFEEQRKAAEELRNLDKLKNQFLATMSHELRTPLNAILNFTYFVSSELFGTLNPKQKETLGKVTDSATHLLALINDILDFSKIDAGMMRLFWEDVDLNLILDKVLATANGIPRAANVALVSDIESPLPIIRGDKQRIRQILFNLLSNALKFTQQGTVTLSAFHTGYEILLSVSDTGPGISQEDQPLIFEAFKQTAEGTSKGGTGLGLSISRHLAEAHGGRLWLQSELNVGSTFFVALPLTQPTGEGPESGRA